MNLDEVLAKLAGMPEKQRKEIEKQALAATKDLVFIPSPGPQSEAYFSEADVLLYGGSPGGGKTALEVGLALNCHKRSLIVRRNFVDLAGVLHTLDNILGKENSAIGGNRPVYRKPEGGVIDFMGLGEDIGGKQGNPHDLLCVGRGTPVLMANGTYKAVEGVQVGDEVMTLEGPREVEKTFGPLYKHSVEVRTSRASQVQSSTHELLTPGGWLSSAFPPCEICAPKECQKPHIFYELFYPIHRGLLRLRALLLEGQQRALAAQRVAPHSGQKGSLASGVCKGLAAQGSGFVECGGSTPLSPLRVLSLVLRRGQQLLLRVLVVATRSLLRSSSACGSCGVRKKSSLQDCQEHCSAGFHPCGVHTHVPPDRCAAREGGQLYLHLPNGAELSTPTCSMQGVQEETPTHNPHRPKYAHPYTKGARQASEAVQLSSACCSPVGVSELYDLQVREVNHYITQGGFVNRNCIDEAAQIPENQVRMLMGWLRTDVPGQRCRVVLGSNPPLNSTGDWLIPFFAPWLDPQHPRPAREGELRYFLPNENGTGDRECGKDEFAEIHGVKVSPQSRTFIGSKFTDNPYYDEEQYAKSLAGLPDEARRILISGSFLTDRTDDVWQTIPTAWLRAAQDKWNSTPPVGVPMCAIGVDVAQGGNDETVLAIRHDGWYAPLITRPGKETPDGKVVAGLVIQYRRDNAKVIIDQGGGWGGDAYAHLKENQVDAVGYMGVKPSLRRTVDRQLKFFNTRAEAYWRFREALDPSQQGGSPIMLPNDSVMLADLCAPTYEIGPNGIKIEPKEKVCDRIGRSPDRGDAVVMAWWDGLKQANVKGGWKALSNKKPQVVMGRKARR